VHYPDERWFKPGRRMRCRKEMLDEYCLGKSTTPMASCAPRICTTPTPATKRGICSLPFVRQSDGEVVYFPSNLIDNLFLSNGMSAGNTLAEAQVQCLSEIFERAVKREILEGEIALPDVPRRCWRNTPASWPAFRAGGAGLSGAGEGCLAGRQVSGDVRDPDEPAHRRRVRLLRRAPQPSRWRWSAA
jgi:ribosomal protein S12 methylthiotransferase accessory factor